MGHRRIGFKKLTVVGLQVQQAQQNDLAHMPRGLKEYSSNGAHRTETKKIMFKKVIP